jgi:microcystin-dependent protein
MPSLPIRVDDLLVEIRNSTLGRVGSIPAPDLVLKMQPVFNGIGSWSVTLPAEHKKVPLLRSPGAGIIVTNLQTGEIIMSGTASKPSKKATSSDPKGLVTIAGLDDNRLPFDALAAPSPSVADFAAQTAANDVRTANAEVLMRQYVDANIGPSAPAGRKTGSIRTRIALEASITNLGATLTKRPRFQNLGELLNEISLESGVNLGWRMVQVGNTIEFQVYQPTDRSAFIRLDVANGTLSDQSVEFAPPEVTRMAVAGQGEGVARKIVSVTTTEAIAAEAEWGLIIEEFKDQRQTNVETELISAGIGDLNERGFTKVAVKATPSNDQTMVFMVDFFLGDKVTVIIDGQEPKSYVTEAAILVDDKGISTAVAIGDIKDFDSNSAIRGQVNDNTTRISSLERNMESGLKTAGIMVPYAGGVVPAGFLLCDGSAVSRTDYAALFAAIGTAWGAGNGTTTFNVPDMRKRVPVGRDASDTRFDVIGETGGVTDQALTEAQLPVHYHEFNGQTFTWGQGNISFNNQPQAQASPPTGNGLGTYQDQPGWAYTATTGSGQAHNNMQPYGVAQYMISTGLQIPYGTPPSLADGVGVDVTGSGTSMDPYKPNLKMDWAMMGGPLVHAGGPGGPYATTWYKGVIFGRSGVFSTSASNLGITILETGIYELESKHRAAQANVYSTLALNGDRTALENRADGIFNHDHSAGADNYSTSQYRGVLEAGLVVTMGPPAGQGGTMRFGSLTIYGTLVAKRIG